MAIKVAVPHELEYLLKNRKDIEIDMNIGTVLNDDFIKNYTYFDSFYDFVMQSPYTDDELASDSKLFESDAMNKYINDKTQFLSYEEMFGFAAELYLIKLVEQYKEGVNNV